MVVAGIPTRENDIRVTDFSTVRDLEAKHASIEMFHLRHVVNEYPDVTNAQLDRLDRVLGGGGSRLRHNLPSLVQ